jgi:hypothetical protein
MADLGDYSGPYKPDLKLEDFSKAALIRLYEAACKDYLGIDGIWLAEIRQKYGEKVAFEHDVAVWEGGTKGEVRRTREALNIWGDDVESVMKYIQTSCHALDYFEKHKDETLLKQACDGLCIPYNQRSADWFNPKIKWTAVKLPPRKSKDEPACIWDITLEE